MATRRTEETRVHEAVPRAEVGAPAAPDRARIPVRRGGGIANWGPIIGVILLLIVLAVFLLMGLT